jgi:CubicO group peptidase (beta-lactamase class C family)
VVHIASAGKWLAAATIAAVVEEGKLSWDDKVKKWLPEFTDVKGQATLRQLLSHTSGYPDYQPEHRHPDNYQTLVEAVKHIVDLPADTVPGAGFHYGGLAMQVAGRMAELATKKDFESIFREKIARPLQMKNTHFTPVDTTQGHNPMIGGGARATLYDYAHFLEMILNEGSYRGIKVLERSSIIEMQADQVKDASVQAGEYVEKVRALDHNSIYGLGEWREILDGNGEATLISSPSWAGAYPWIDKENNIYGFFLTHVVPRVAKEEGFSSFLASPVLATMTREIVHGPNYGTKKGKMDIGNAKLYYEMSGYGEPLILLHGHTLDTRMWDRQFKVLSQKYRVVRYDLRGYGKSDMPMEDQHFLHANDLSILMDSLKIEKAHVVGLSLGAFIVTDFMALYPERLLSAIVTSGSIHEVPGPDRPITEGEKTEKRAEIAKINREGLRVYKERWLDSLLKSTGSQGRSIRQDLKKMVDDWSGWQVLHIEPRPLLGSSVKKELERKRIKVPVLILVGKSDSEGSHNSMQKLADLIPSVHITYLNDAGHLNNLERPEAFNNALLSFLEQNGGTPN